MDKNLPQPPNWDNPYFREIDDRRKQCRNWAIQLRVPESEADVVAQNAIIRAAERFQDFRGNCEAEFKAFLWFKTYGEVSRWRREKNRQTDVRFQDRKPAQKGDAATGTRTSNEVSQEIQRDIEQAKLVRASKWHRKSPSKDVQRNQESADNGGNTDTTANVRGDEPDPHEAAWEKERDTLLHRAISELSCEHQQVIELRDFRELSWEKINEILMLRDGTARARHEKAKKILREKLASSLDPNRLDR